MGLSFELDPPLTDELRAAIVALWVDVTNAGGAVGFVPPVSAADVLPTADAAFHAVSSGVDHLLVELSEGRPVGLLFVADNGHDLKSHWRTLKRVMVAPDSQGRGYGDALMREATVVAQKLGLKALQVTVRAGLGTENFYTRFGYREVGRVPGAIRVAPGDDRDEIIMWLDLG